MTPYTFHPSAESELVDAARYYETCRPGLGASFLAEARRCLDEIRAHPQIGSILGEDVRRRGLRRFPYSLLYTEDPSGIRILAVMHQKRRPGYWRGRI